MQKFSKSINFLAVAILFIFVSISIFSLTAFTKMDNEDSMSTCLLMSQAQEPTGCQMTITQHVKQWQQMFTAISGANNLIFFLTLLPLGLTLLAKQFMLDPPSMQVYKRYLKENQDLKLFDYLLLAMSRGILHSRVYA